MLGLGIILVNEEVAVAIIHRVGYSKPQSRAKFRAALLSKLPFEADVMLCDGRDLLRLETANPFGTQPSPPDVVRFVSILSKAGAVRAWLPVSFPSDGQWLVRVMASEGQFVFDV